MSNKINDLDAYITDILDRQQEELLSSITSSAGSPTSDSVFSLEKMMAAQKLIADLPPPPPRMFIKTANGLEPLESHINLRDATELSLQRDFARLGVVEAYAIPDKYFTLPSLTLKWDDIVEPAAPEEPPVTFKQFVRKYWTDYLRTVLPALVVFGVASQVAVTSPSFYIAAVLAVLFLTGLTIAQQYNRWYPYYGPDGMLKKKG